MTALNVESETVNVKFINSIESIFDAFFLLSKENQILLYKIKDEYIKLYFGEENLQNKNFISVFISKEKKGRKVELIQKIEKKSSSRFEYNLSVNGQNRYYEIFIFALSNYQTLITLRNIDERQNINAEQKLKESEQMYRNLFNSTPYAIWLVDLKGEIIDCNETMDKFLAIFNYADLIGKSFRDVLKMFAREGDPRFENLEKLMRDRFKILLEKGYIKPIEFEINRGDGKTFWITLESAFVNIGENRLIQTFIKDITEKKLAEIELEDLRRDLEKRVKERTIKLENSEKKYRMAYNRANCFKGLFTHDISNMFHTIGNSIDLCDILLKEGVKNDNLIDYFDVIEQQINRGKRLINNIKSLSEIEESEIPLLSTEIFDKLRSAIQFVKLNFPKQDISFNVKADFDEIYVLANDLLLDVFENILINSVLYNKNESIDIEIDISKLRENEISYIKLEFKDNGIGIKEDRKNLIFVENNKKRTESKGMGLGLSLVAKFIDLCKGKIWVEDRIKEDYSQGSNFVILMPEVE
ncbi:MAG: PAS domain S-box protein [Promethearchaeota archaeon]